MKPALLGVPGGREGGVVAEREKGMEARGEVCAGRRGEGEGQRWRRLATKVGTGGEEAAEEGSGEGGQGGRGAGSKKDLQVRLAELPLQLRTFTLTFSTSDLFLLH